MIDRTAYLVGPISGITYEEACDWRKPVTDELESYGITCFSPLRGKEYLGGKGILAPVNPSLRTLSTNHGIVMRDHNDVATKDLLFCNFLEAEIVSIGSVWEIGIGFAYRKPIVVVMEENSLHWHSMILESAFVVPTLEEGIEITRKVLLP